MGAILEEKASATVEKYVPNVFRTLPFYRKVE